MAGQELSVSQLARVFECHPARLTVALENGFDEPKPHSRHSAFDHDSEGGILIWVKAQTEKSGLVTRTDLRYYYQTKYSHPVTRGWADSFILRDGDVLAKTKSVPQEDTRLEVPRAFLDETKRYTAYENTSRG
jgi:hypothetical protein